MTAYVALLRGVNVAGHARVSMERTPDVFESMGLERVRTYIQSGNIVFEQKSASATGLVERLERGIKAKFDLDVHVIVRTTEEMSKVIENISIPGIGKGRVARDIPVRRTGRCSHEGDRGGER